MSDNSETYKEISDKLIKNKATSILLCFSIIILAFSSTTTKNHTDYFEGKIMYKNEYIFKTNNFFWQDSVPFI